MGAARLSKLPMRMATEATLCCAKKTHYVTPKYQTRRYKRNTILHACRMDDMLVLTKYRREEVLCDENRPALVTYLGKDKYISFFREEEADEYKRRTGMIQSIPFLGSEAWYNLDPAIEDEESKKAIFEFTGIEEDEPEQCVAEYQAKIMQKKLDARHKKIKDAIDEEMTCIPALPKDYRKFVLREVLPQRYFLYDYKSGKEQTGLCTNCGKRVSIAGVRFNGEVTCPRCNNTLTAKAKGKATWCVDREYWILPQRLKNDAGFVFRFFTAGRRIVPKTEENKLSNHEYFRIICKGEKVKSYEYMPFLSTGEVRWCNAPEQRCGLSYLKNVYPHTWEITKGTYLEHINMDRIVLECATLEERMYTQKRPILVIFEKLETHYRLIEQLQKVGLHKVVYSAICASVGENVDTNQPRLHKALGITRAGLKHLIANDGDRGLLDCIRAVESRGQTASEEVVSTLNALLEHAQAAAIEEALRFVPLKRLKMYYDNVLYTDHWTVSDYRDYLRAAERNQLYMTSKDILYPANFGEAHDTLFNKERIKARAQDEGLYEKRKAQLTKYAYECQGECFVVRIPDNLEEIAKEGRCLRHCVGGYIANVAKGKTNIVFVRRAEEPDEPFMTMEISPDGRMVQCRGFGNNARVPVPEDAQEFIEHYRQVVLDEELKQAC